ncbi:unnamed protein product [Phytophthora fragariaefolia]|uniref:Unnamed protein product n=1 Tax=Phytophthora fragariaefolia TaxID=1490495 RepID=A0A9W6TZ22_9STRA|nr:unnamed protein product [Phytophthora fragariaefolia]
MIQPPNPDPSPGNIEPRRPFEVVSMDFVTHMPESARGNTFLLLFQDSFSDYVMCKPMSSTTAQDVAEAYEEQIFRRFGASAMIRHDQDPRFMSEVFTRFRELLGSKQRVTLAYRPQANEQQERSVQTVIRSVKAYIAEADESDWDEHAEKLMFALNTSFDTTRLDTPFYLVHGWDAQGTVTAMLGPKPSSLSERTTYEWRHKFQRDYGYALACARDVQKKAKRAHSEEQARKWREFSERLKSGFEKGDAVWLFNPKVQPGRERSSQRVELDLDDDDDFDAALLPEDSWEPDISNDEYEGEKILDLRWVKRPCTSKRTREYLVTWRSYDDPEWIPVTQLSCGGLLYEFNEGARARHVSGYASGRRSPESIATPNDDFWGPCDCGFVILL